MGSVLFLGKSDRRIELWAKAHAKVVAPEGGRVILLALYGENYTDGNFTFVNCHTLPREYTAADIQRRAGGSLNRALACDRSLTDYTWSTSFYSYSKYTTAQMEQLVEVMGNGILHYIDELDYCVDGLWDNFVSPLAFQLATRAGVPFYMIRMWQYWDTRFHIVDSPGYVSSLVDRYYAQYYARIPESVYTRVRDEFVAARFSPGAFLREGLGLRLQIVRDKMASYERPSLRNFLLRKVNRTAGQLWARRLRFTPQSRRPAKYIVFALHVMPEASILGTDPEVADLFSLIRRMSLNVPLGVQILCKAHPGDRFGRDLEIGFLRRLCSLHNVSLVPESEGIGSFIDDERCLAIATINGSVALDAVVAGKPCFLFGQGIFRIADCFLKPATDDEFFEQVSALADGTYRIDTRALAAIILAMKRATVGGAMSLARPGTWLEVFTSLLPSVHEFHKRTHSQARSA